MKAIIALDKHTAAFANHGDLVYWSKKDLANFKKLTSKSENSDKPTVVMGSGTWRSMKSKPLPGRHNVVITSKHDQIENTEDVSYVDLAWLLDNMKPNWWVIGGAKLLQQLFEKDVIQSLYLTLVDSVGKMEKELQYDIALDWLYSHIEPWTKCIYNRDTDLCKKNGVNVGLEFVLYQNRTREESVQEIRSLFQYWLDDKFHFDEPSHSYTFEKRKLRSVSSFISRFHEEFDKEEVSKATAIKRGVSQQSLLAEWKKTNEVACDLGHDVHYYIECDMNGDALPTFSETERQNRIKAYHDLKQAHLRHLTVIFSEFRCFDLELGLAGTVDGIYWDGNELLMYDWKTNKAMSHDNSEHGRWKKLYWPWHKEFDNKHNRYSIQLSMYRYMLKKRGIHIPIGRLFHFPPEGGFKKLDCKDYFENIDTYFKHFKPI